MSENLGRTFFTIVRAIDSLRAIIDSEPYASFRLPSGSKQIVTFLRKGHPSKLSLPIEVDGARLLAMTDREVFGTYLPNPRGPVFMTLIEKTFGSEVTTRTWETVKKIIA
jgi:uncharacterized protein (DUF1697 family)